MPSQHLLVPFFLAILVAVEAEAFVSFLGRQSVVCHIRPKLEIAAFVGGGGGNDGDSDDEPDFKPILSPFQRKVVFGGAFVAENIVSYTGPGSDGTLFPQSDLELITQQLLNPQVIQSPPNGSGVGIFSYLLFNSFIYLPIVWSALLLPENCGGDDNKTQPLPVWPFVVSSAAFGGIGLYPYLAVRESRKSVNVERSELPIFLSLLEGTFDRFWLVLINMWLLWVFLLPFLSGHSNITEECQGFVQLIRSSPFACTTAVDVCFLGIALVDPISDDAKHRRVLENDAVASEAIAQLLFPYLIPVFGSLLWILIRPQLPKRLT